MEVKKTIPFIKKHLAKLQLKLYILREAMKKIAFNIKHDSNSVMRMSEVNRKFRIRSVL